MVQVAKATSTSTSAVSKLVPPALVPLAAEKPAKGKKSKKSQKGIDKLGRRVVYVKGLVDVLVETFAAQQGRLEPEAETEKLLGQMLAHVKGASKQIEEGAKVLFRLRDAKWEPSSGTRPFRAGDVAQVRARRTERFTKHGAYTLADLKGIKVVSVHGDSAKITTPKGESLGLVPFSWLSHVEK